MVKRKNKRSTKQERLRGAKAYGQSGRLKPEPRSSLQPQLGFQGKRVDLTAIENAREVLGRFDDMQKILGAPPEGLHEAVKNSEKILREAGAKANSRELEIDLGDSNFNVSSRPTYLLRKRRVIEPLKDEPAEIRDNFYSELVLNPNLNSVILKLTKYYEGLPDNGGVKNKGPLEGASQQRSLEFNAGAAKPRWAEENRPNVRVAMRMSEKLIEEITLAARDAGMNRTDWFVWSLNQFLQRPGTPTPPDSPEYKTNKPIQLRFPEELNEEIEERAKLSGLSKTEWIRRVARNALSSPTPGQDLAP